MKFGISRKSIAKICLALCCASLFMVLAGTAASASEGDGDLPWNTSLDKLVKALSGKTALLVSCIGLFFAGGMLIFGGDLGNFGKSMMMLVLVGSIMGGLMQVVQFFVSSGALLP